MSDASEDRFAGSWPITDDAVRDAFQTMLTDGSWGQYHGVHCDRLRSELGQFHQTEHALLCSSGTAAVELALRAVPVTSDDEVILCAYDFKSNFVNVLTVGATPVLIDAVPDSPTMDLNQLESACSPRTRAIVVSHLHGSMAPIEEICEFARLRGITVIEDACQSPGALINGQRAGSVGDIGVLSFGGSKLLTSGRGGAVISSNALMMQRIKLYTQRGNDAYPLSEMQAAVILPQLNQLNTRNAERLARVRLLCEQLASTTTMSAAFCLPDPDDLTNMPVFYKSAFQLREDAFVTRDHLCQAARAAGIPLDPGFPALNLIHSARRFRAVSDLRHARGLHARLMVLHHTALLQSAAKIIAMSDVLKTLVDETSG
jgi:dTDP-4-amino-4,6-dideoxygalactose transaminase